MTQLPEWVLRHKGKGIAIEERNGCYYATRVKSVWDPAKHRARKITPEYLGVVTPDGIIPPKNTLEGDKTWMQRRESLQGYFFILFIALYIHSYLLDHLRRKKLLKNYSVHNVLWELSKIYTVEVDDKMVVGEVPKAARKLIGKLEVPITEKLVS